MIITAVKISAVIILMSSCTYEFTISPWEDGRIPYYLDGEFSNNDVNNIREAMDAWESVCGVWFEEVSPRSSAYKIIRANANEWLSSIGENNSDCHMIFGRTYSDIDVIIHELGHCLGLMHEHQRPDRDEYVIIVWDNILTGKEYNFDIVDNPLFTEQDFDYDFQSIMHYAPGSFSINGSPTIISIEDYAIYQSGGITELDAAKARAIYGPPLEEDDIHE
ncbi:MAG TPA: M12 family metallopeptidase [Spirochaetota bacterium]|nr:M12 family metallopeptidase [Spirochaetota bacterium]